MTLFVIVAGLLVAVALAFLIPPLLRSRSGPTAASRATANTLIYREQLGELRAELDRGAVTREEFDRAGREIERRIVAEHAASTAPAEKNSVAPAEKNSVAPAKAGVQPLLAAAVAVGLLVPLLAALGYWQLGSPNALSGAATEPARTVSPEQMESLVERLAARMQQTPEDAEGWMLLGRSLGVLGQYDRAAQAYARASQLAPKDAGLLADYADTLAMARGRKLEGEPFAIVKRALAIDPEHLKSLGLAGSAEFERRDYAAAIVYWERILKVAPPQSDFARSVAESIAEARALQKGNQSLQGIVSIEPALAAKLSPGDTVFVLARPVSGSRMPLAVARTTVAALPYRFTLDDSMAMAPGATISSHAQVVVAARVSKTGNAIPQKGDVEGASAPVAPGATGVQVVLSNIVD